MTTQSFLRPIHFKNIAGMMPNIHLPIVVRMTSIYFVSVATSESGCEAAVPATLDSRLSSVIWAVLNCKRVVGASARTVPGEVAIIRQLAYVVLDSAAICSGRPNELAKRGPAMIFDELHDLQ